ncbi:HNH endonuclease [Streptacidiphilus alkalitolerans]|uniref:HNH endonuclease n=1 Tax=Streptacidiphilus alkalitolerans TaxID=3342712 RepID=UPI0036D2BCD5
MARYNFQPAKRFLLQHEGRLYDAKAIVNAAYQAQHGQPAPHIISGGRAHSNALLEKLGFTVVDRRPTTVEGELAWRLALWAHLEATQDLAAVPPQALREFDAYGGQQGIWVDSARTSLIGLGQIAVSFLHTGADYPDDMTDDAALYHYPTTRRLGERDQAEINATKTAANLKLPIFVISKPTPRSAVRGVQLAWVEGWEDQSKLFLVTYNQAAPERIIQDDRSDESAFVLSGNRSHQSRRNVRVRPGQPRFKLEVFQRYGPRCVLSGIAVPEMIEAAHLRPVADEGSDDPRNGLPLNGALHRAFDAHLFAIEPESLEVVTRPQGPSLEELHITVSNLKDLPRKPHHDALEWRYQEWRRRTGLN